MKDMTDQPQVIYQQQPQVVYQVQPQQQPPPQIVYVQTPPPTGVYQPTAPQAQQPQTIVVNNMVHQDVNHGCHAILCCCTGGLWLPVWVLACLDIACQRPCG